MITNKVDQKSVEGMYTTQEKCIRSLMIVARMLETVTPLLPAEYQVVVEEVLALHGQLW